MKRVVITLLALPLLVAAFMPLLVGNAINNPEQLDQLREQLGQPGMVLELDRGWFRTTGRVTVSDPVIGQRRHPGVSFTAPVTVQHGPLLWTDTGLQLGLAYGVAQPRLDAAVDDPVFNALLTSATPPRVTVLAELDTDLSLHWSNDTLYYDDGEQILTAENFLMQATVSSEHTADIDLHADKIRGSSLAFGSVEAENPALLLHGRDPNGTLLPHSLQLSLPRLHIDAAEQLTLHDIRIDYAAREEGGSKVRVEQHVQVAQIDSRAPLSALRMDTVTQDIDVELFRQLRALMSNPGNSAQTADELLLRLQRNPLSQHTNAMLNLWGGEHLFTLDLNWPGIPGLMRVDQLDSQRLMHELSATLNIRADVAAIERSFIAIMARNYAAQGMLPVDNDQYVLDMSLQGGTLNVNGQNIELTPILNLLSLMTR